MVTEAKKKQDGIGMKVGGAVGAAVAFLTWFLFLRTPGRTGGYLPASDHIAIIILAVLVGALGAWLGDVAERRLGSGSKI